MANFDGYVLCGGASRRMGRDKALLEVDGVPMARRVAAALTAAGAGKVVAVGGDAAGLVALGLAHRPDRWPGEGPLGGLITALEEPDGGSCAVVVACDLVAPDPDAFAAVAEAQQRLDCDVVVPVVEGHRQWLHAAWDRRVTGILTDLFDAGERSLAGAALGVRLATIEGIGVGAVRDADRPEDLPTGRG